MKYDLELPYQDACQREDKYQDIVETETDNLWDEVQDPAKAEELIDCWEADPQGELAKLLARYAELKKTKDYKAFFYRAAFYFDDLVEKAAQRNAQRIYDNQ
jgi:hypothetical protein